MITRKWTVFNMYLQKAFTLLPSLLQEDEDENQEAEEEFREGKLQWAGGRREEATYDAGDVEDAAIAASARRQAEAASGNAEVILVALERPIGEGTAYSCGSCQAGTTVGRSGSPPLDAVDGTDSTVLAQRQAQRGHRPLPAPRSWAAGQQDVCCKRGATGLPGCQAATAQRKAAAVLCKDEGRRVGQPDPEVGWNLCW